MQFKKTFSKHLAKLCLLNKILTKRELKSRNLVSRKNSQLKSSSNVTYFFNCNTVGNLEILSVFQMMSSYKLQECDNYSMRIFAHDKTPADSGDCLNPFVIITPTENL